MVGSWGYYIPPPVYTMGNLVSLYLTGAPEESDDQVIVHPFKRLAVDTSQIKSLR